MTPPPITQPPITRPPITRPPIARPPITQPPITHRRGSTWLMTPGGAPDRFDAAAASGADVVLLDLEDAVPTQSKTAARAAVLRYLATTARPTTAADTPGGGRPVLGLRLNAVDTGHGLRDLLAIADAGFVPSVVLLPKVEAARDIDLVATVLAGASSSAVSGVDVIADVAPRRWVWALIETPRAIECLPEILRARSVAGVVFGAADYAAAAGCRRDARALLYPRSALVAAAAAAGLPAVDSPYFDLHDSDGLRGEAEHARDLGYLSKGAVHPAQLDVIRAVFTPSPAELGHARAVVAAADQAGGGIITIEGRIVGPPMVAAAQAVHAHAPGNAGHGAGSP